MAAAGYDAMTVGNHEPDFSAQWLSEQITRTPFPFVAANVHWQETGQTLAPPYVVREVGGVSVGILGLAYPNTPLTTSAENVAGLAFKPDSAAVVREHLPHMRRDGAQVIVVLSHLGLGADIKLAGEVEGIDVIVGGHSHNRMAAAKQVRGTLIVQAGAHGSDVGRLDLIVENGRVVGHRRELILLDNAVIPSDDAMARLVKAKLDPFRAEMDERVGRAAKAIVRAQTLAGQDPRKRDQQSPADSLFADILRTETGSDVALLPGVGYGVAIPAGPITADALRNLIPHEGKVVTMKLSGEQIRQVLEQAVENTYSDDPSRKVGGMIQVSGLVFEYDPGQARGSRVHRVTVGAEPLSPARRYSVATNSMLAGGGHNYRTFREGDERREHASQYEIVRAWLSARDGVTAPADVRIVNLGRQVVDGDPDAPRDRPPPMPGDHRD